MFATPIFKVNDQERNWWYTINKTSESNSRFQCAHSSNVDNYIVPIGSYLYTEVSSPVGTGDRARLRSQMFTTMGSQARCLVFWYHMYGISIGTLRVILATNFTGETTLWELSGNQGNKWLQGRLQIKSNADFNVSFLNYLTNVLIQSCENYPRLVLTQSFKNIIFHWILWKLSDGWLRIRLSFIIYKYLTY